MTISVINGNPILKTELDNVWDSVSSTYTNRAAQYEVNNTTFYFDGAEEDWFVGTTSPKASVIWTPPIDCKILQITTQIGSPTQSGIIDLEMTGNLMSPLVWACAASASTTNQTRTTVTLPTTTGAYSVLAGDQIEIAVVAVTSLTAADTLVRVHILTTSKWSKI